MLACVFLNEIKVPSWARKAWHVYLASSVNKGAVGCSVLAVSGPKRRMGQRLKSKYPQWYFSSCRIPYTEKPSVILTSDQISNLLVWIIIFSHDGKSNSLSAHSHCAFGPPWDQNALFPVSVDSLFCLWKVNMPMLIPCKHDWRRN